jgi:iron complex transport system substrate-binding protein
MSMFGRLAQAGALALPLSLAAPSLTQESAGVFPASAKIVAIGGSVTEIVYALGEQDRLAARDSTSTYPPDALKLPDVGYMRQLSPEGVLSVNPDGILALEGSGPREAVEVLKKAGVPFVEVPESFDHAGILEKIRVVGHALDADAKAEALASQVDARLKEAEKQADAAGPPKRVLFILSLQGGRILASGSGTAADGIIRLAGGVNAVEGYSGYKQLSDEAVIAARPDVVLMMDRGGAPGGEADPFANPAIAATPAGAAKKLVRMDGTYLLGFGPRTADAIADLAGALQDEQRTD